MTRAGVNVSINSDSDERARRLNIDAAKMMRYGGLSEEEALKLITLNPAWQLGIEERVGSIEVGKDADLAIWNGHPFSIYSRVEQTIIDGEVFFDRQRELARRPALEQERQRLLQLEANRAPAQGGTPPPRPAAIQRAGSSDDEGDNHP
jgi:cytosine/adenosine deaminase-related metal-dependent hydrolase